MGKNPEQGMNTSQSYHTIIAECRELFIKKSHDYGSAWRILRTASMTDQIFIKANRIRSIQMSGVQKVEDDIRGDFIGIINYSIMALIQLELGELDLSNYLSEDIGKTDLSPEEAIACYDQYSEKVISYYDKYAQIAHDLMQDKNHDYGEAWRDMRQCSFVDLILQKIFRIKQIEEHDGKTLVSEGIDANYYDMINYAVFALIQVMNPACTKLHPKT